MAKGLTIGSNGVPIESGVDLPDGVTGTAAVLSQAQSYTAQQSCTPSTASISGNAVTLNMASRNAFTTSLTANITTVTVQNIAAGQSFVWLLTNTGSFTVSFPASMVFLLPSGVTNAVASGSGKRTIVSGFCFDGSTFLCTIAKEA